MSFDRDYDLFQRMRDLDAEDPDAWAESELSQDIAQEARWLIIRTLQREFQWGGENIANLETAEKLIASGADPALVVGLANEVTSEAVFSVLDVIDEGADPEAPEDAPGWILMETRTDNDGGITLTGRDVGGLHESWTSD